MTIRVLNINDSASNRYYVSRVLRSAGWDVLEAATGAEGIALAKSASPNVGVLDIKLPDMSGLEVCRRLRADPVTADMLIIQTSATFVTSEGKARGLQSGADQYLTQPFESVELIAMVKSLIRLREKELESRAHALALVQADRRKDEFLAMLAHELRNPLSAIAMATSLLQGMKLDDGAGKLTRTIERQTKNLARLIDDLLDVARITRGKIDLKSEPIDLTTAVKRFMETEGASLVRRHAVTIHAPEGGLWISGDPTRIDQILSNLVSNAVKYTPQGGTISVALREVARDPRSVELLVTDSGIGIDAAHVASIFDLFFQVDDSLARSNGGLGIGLTIVKRLAELHGGSVDVRSAGIGRGAEFRVAFPLVERDAATPSAEALAPRVHRNELGPFDVLIIDDNVDASELQALAFEREGHRVRVAHDGAVGLELALTARYDVALVDIGLPFVDGFAIASRVRAARLERDPVLIAVTGYGRETDRERSRAAGFDAHTVKPVDIRYLSKTVTELVAERRSKLARRSA